MHTTDSPLDPTTVARAVERPSARPTASPERGRAIHIGGPERERLRMSLRILLHIANQGRFGPGELAPWALSQPGMVEVLRLNQGALAGALQRLVRSGVLTVNRTHVRGHDRRLKVYQLTGIGVELVRDLRARSGGAGSR